MKKQTSYRFSAGAWQKGLGWVLLIMLLAANLVVGARLYTDEQTGDDRDAAYEYMSLFTRAVEQVRRHYVDDTKVSYRDLIYGALRGMLQSLDPHSSFLKPRDFSDMKDDTQGHFGGLGIVISIRGGVLTIVAPMEDTPGFKAGLMAGDKIIEIDGEPTENMTLEEAVGELRGAPGTRVTIKVLSPESRDIREVTVVRADIDVPSVKDAEIMDGGIAYLRITQFNEPTGDALSEALERLQEEGSFDALVLDLRNNPGGLLRAAVDVAQLFLPRGELVVYTQGRNKEDRQTFLARGRGGYLEMPMVILVNSGSASASEIVAGALQDHRRAVLLGEKTFGKGSVQSVLPMEDGSAIRVTTAKYYTPSRRVIHDQGIEPDITVPMSPGDWRKLLIQRSSMADDKMDADTKPVEDVQLQRALDVLRGIMAYQENGNHVDTRH